jgi:hypothetical protein
MMNLEVKSRIRPYHRALLQRGISCRFRRWGPVSVGREAWFEIEYRDVEKDEYPLLSIKPVVVEPHGVEGGVDRWQYLDWWHANMLSMKYFPSMSGYAELRLYFKDLTDSDTITDDYGRSQTFKGNVGTDEDVRYYYKPFLVYSTYDVISIVFAGLTILFTCVVCILTFVLAVLTYGLLVHPV